MDDQTAKPEPHGQRVTSRLVLSIFSAVLGMYVFGYNTGVVNNPQGVIRAFYNQTYMGRHNGSPIPDNTLTILWAFTVAIFAAGGMIGSFIGGWWADRFGRKPGIMVNTIFGMVAGVLMAVGKPAKSYEVIIIGRFIIGFNAGLYTSICPMYNSEVAYPSIRGAVGVLNQLGVTTGILTSQVFGLRELLGNERLWPVVLGITAIPPFLQLLTMPLNPESPRYLLLVKKNEEGAVTALQTLRGTDDVGDEIEEMKLEQEASASEESISILQLLRSSSLRLPLIISVVMHLSQQFSGINCVFYYSKSLFMNIGIAEKTAGYATLAVGGIMVTMTIVTIPLMDRAGRRTLHLAGLGGMFVFSIVFTITFTYKDRADWLKYFSMISALVFVMFFALGPGSIPWLIVAEFFSQGPRPAAISIAVLVNWASNFVVGQSFPSLQRALKNLVFIPFTCLIFLFFIFLLKFLPETKNKTFEEISALFNKGDRISNKSQRDRISNKNQRGDNPELKGVDGVYKSFQDGQTLNDSIM